jgi:DNA-binding PadR family transcriptional regulator
VSVRYGLLGLLAQGPRHGYELHSEFVALAGGKDRWDVKPPQIYSTLTRLQDGGLVAEVGVEQEGGPEKRILAITPAGRAELDAWFETPVMGEHMRDELFVKLMLSLADGEPGGETARQVIHVQREALYRDLHRVTARRQTADPREELGQILLLDKTAMHLEADLRWLEMVEARLDEVQRQPLPQPEPRPRGRPKKR